MNDLTKRSKLQKTIETNLWFIPWIVTSIILYKIVKGKI